MTTECQFCKGTKVERLAADDVVACAWCDSTGVDGGLSKGDTDPVGDCGKFESGVNVGPWMQRVVVYGDTAAQAERLRDKILALMVADQPPALGDDLDDALRDMASVACQSALSHGIGEHEFLKLARGVRQLVEAPLQAEIERWKAISAVQKDRMDVALELAKEHREERDQIKARCDDLEKDAALLDYLQDQLVDTIYLDDGRIIDIAGRVTVREGVRAHMSKPAGSEQV